MNSTQNEIFTDGFALEDRFTLSDDKVGEIVDRIDANLSQSFPKKKKRNLFIILSELMEYVNTYSESNTKHQNRFDIGYDAKGIIVIECTNLLSLDKMNMVQSALEKLQNADKSELHDQYIKLLSNESEVENVLDGIGFLLIFKEASNADFSFSSLEDGLYKFKFDIIY